MASATVLHASKLSPRRALIAVGVLLSAGQSFGQTSSAAVGVSSEAPATRPPSADECIDFHRQGQTERLHGHLLTAAEEFRACLSPACSPVLRNECATLLRQVETEVPTVVLAATTDRGDLVDVSVLEGDTELSSRLDGRPLTFDPGPHTLRFEAEGYQPAEVLVVLRAGERNRLVNVRLSATHDTDDRAAGTPPADGFETDDSPHLAPRDDDRLSAQGRVAPPDEEAATDGPFDGWDYVLFGSGIALGGAGLVVTSRFFEAAEQAHSGCAPTCGPETLASLRRQERLSIALVSASGALLIGGGLRFLLKADGSKEVSVLVNPTTVRAQFRY